MEKLYELKEMLCKELEEYGQKGELTAGSLEVIDKLAHAIKNICKIIEAYEEEEYSNAGGSYARGGNRGGGRSSRGYSREGGSYARGGSYASYAQRRDSRGRYSNEGYSRDEGMIMELKELMKDVPDERTRQEFQSFISRMENM